mmetsp:Transcript_26181/g.57586  ORF Transcript_26181/g.57586 Transcript_26181/m.57586 type:complete len:236 (-) Transcript_26181:86-793(-)
MGEQSKLGVCCLVVPLKLGVCLLYFYQFIFGFVCIASLLAGDNRLQSGGYNPRVEHWQAWLGQFGILFGLLGFFGCHQEQVTVVKVCNIYLYVKIAVMLLVFAADLGVLAHCEALEGKAEINFSPLLYTVAQKGLCSEVQLSYVIGFLVDFGLHAHWTWAAYDFQRKVKSNPAYLIGFESSEESQMEVGIYDEILGEPSEYLGKPLEKSQEIYGVGYGAVHYAEQPHTSQSHGHH